MRIQRVAAMFLTIGSLTNGCTQALSSTQLTPMVDMERAIISPSSFSFTKEWLSQAARDASVAYDPKHGSSENETVLPLEQKEFHRGHVLVRRQGSEVDIVVAIKGTSDFRDGVTDVTLPMVQCDEIYGEADRVHRGFYSRAQELLPCIQDRLQKVFSQLSPSDTARVHLVGHSLGGAVSTLTALMLENNKELIPQGIASVSTFGAPPTGNSSFVEAYNKILGERTAHVVQTSDPVTLLGHQSCVSWKVHTKLFCQEKNPHGISNYQKALSADEPAWYQKLAEEFVRKAIVCGIFKLNTLLPPSVHHALETGEKFEEAILVGAAGLALSYMSNGTVTETIPTLGAAE